MLRIILAGIYEVLVIKSLRHVNNETQFHMNSRSNVEALGSFSESLSFNKTAERLYKILSAFKQFLISFHGFIFSPTKKSLISTDSNLWYEKKTIKAMSYDLCPHYTALGCVAYQVINNNAHLLLVLNESYSHILRWRTWCEIERMIVYTDIIHTLLQGNLSLFSYRPTNMFEWKFKNS